MMYDASQRTLTAIRLKECRKLKGFSHDKLAETLQTEYGIKISGAVLKNYEVRTLPGADEFHSKKDAVAGMNIEYLYTLADFYSVSTDYLLGRTGVKSPDPNIKSVCDFTGLSEIAVKTLKHRKDLVMPYGFFLSEFIRNNKSLTLFNYIYAYVDSAVKCSMLKARGEHQIGIYEDLQEGAFKFPTLWGDGIPAEYDETLKKPNPKYEEETKKQLFSLWSAEKTFTKVIESIAEHISDETMKKNKLKEDTTDGKH